MPGATAPGRGLSMQLALVLNSRPPSCLRPLSAGITDMDCHAGVNLSKGMSGDPTDDQMLSSNPV